MNYKAVLFDMDGVIVDSEPLHFAAFKAALEKYNQRLTEEQYKEYFVGRTDEEGLRLYFEFMSEEVDSTLALGEKGKAYLELATDQLKPYPGVVALIKKLSAKLPVALVTGSLRLEVDVVLKTLAIEDDFAAIISAEDVKHGKPDPEGYLKAATALRVQPKACVVIEDSPNGVLAAKRAGIDSIAVTTTHSVDELSQATKVVDIQDLARQFA